MVYTVNLKWLSFKQNLSDLSDLLENEKTTYAIMRYAQDIPSSIYSNVMDFLSNTKEALTYRKLLALIEEYDKVNSAGMTFEDEIEQSVELVVGKDGMMSIRDVGSTEVVPVLNVSRPSILMDDDDDDDEEITIIRM